MASGKALFGAVLGRFIFREATVASVRDIAPNLRLASLSGEALRGVAWTPGDKLQVFLPGEGMRTYTPLSWDATKGETSLLLYVHSTKTPGAAWAAKLAVGDRCRFFGPRSSIAFPESRASVVFVGDETSFAAASALRAAAAVFEVSDETSARAALNAIGLEKATTVSRTPGDAHVDELASLVRIELEARPSAALALTGKAQTIQTVRARLRGDGLLRPNKTKAYWSVGKAGLD